MVEIVEQEPSAAVTQSKFARCLRKRTDTIDVLKKRYFAGAYGGRGTKIDAQTNIHTGLLDHALCYRDPAGLSVRVAPIPQVRCGIRCCTPAVRSWRISS